MSIHIYLKESLRKDEGFSETPYTPKGGGGIKFKGMSIYGDKGRLHAILGDEDKVPTILEEFVEEVTFYDHLNAMLCRRETGIYRLDDAEAMVEQQSSSAATYSIKTRAKNLGTARKLVHQIKTGVIMPTESYEGKQLGPSRSELETQLQNALFEVENLKRSSAKLTIAEDRIRSVQKFAAALSNPRWQWPWCTKQSVASSINYAVNGKGQ